MGMPGFTAQASLDRPNGAYYSRMSTISLGGSIQPAQSFTNILKFRGCLHYHCVSVAPDSTYCYCTQWYWVTSLFPVP
jgi:hypothetical protein